MKTAIYIEDGTVQLVITPESDFEKDSLRVFGDGKELTAQIFRGSFYDCRGGWVRQKEHHPYDIGVVQARSDNECSIILRVKL